MDTKTDRRKKHPPKPASPKAPASPVCFQNGPDIQEAYRLLPPPAAAKTDNEH
ncbi:hypothetical protein [Cyclobacterium xiamenense]|uniref:hypothetical protein n=1 Tax=Cyclobacterium xiamenense TaxID=1297121 RepID=UPI0012B8BF7C|nr:hypothetical protein [Cyclobacterium xiamenense]